MRIGRLMWPTATLLVFCVTSCDNREPFGPIAARQTRDPSGVFAKPVNGSSVQVTWTDPSAPNEIGFQIERSPSGTGSWVLAGTTDRNVTTFSEGGRSSEQQVCYRVFAVFRNGLSNPANSNCTIPPAAPTGLSATVVDHQTIDLSWTDNSAAEQGYEIERATAAAGPFGTVAFVAANTTTYRQSGLTTNTTYWYRVRANKDGGYGDYSNVASAMPIFMPPAAPSGLSAVPQGASIDLRWTDNATNEDGFKLERSDDGGGSWTPAFTIYVRNATAYQVYNGAVEQTVCYRVLAYNAEGASPPSKMACTASPAAPTELNAVAVDQPPAIDLRWKDNSAVEDGYEVWRYDGVTAYHVVASLAANATSYHDAGVNVDQQYWYYVRAAKDGGGSASSNIGSAVVATTPPNGPSTASVYPNRSSSAVVVYWDDNSTNEQAFRIERSTNGGASWEVAGTSDYAYYGFADGGRTPELEVCYRVIAFNVRGDSPPSPVACTVPPAGATNLTATWTDQGVVLNWSDNSNVEDTYEIIFYTICSDQPDYWIASLPPNTTTYNLGPVDPWSWCGDYPVAYVVVTNDFGYGDFSNGVYTAPGASGSSANVAPPPKASLRHARVRP